MDWPSFQSAASGFAALVAGGLALRSYLSGRHKERHADRLAETDQGIASLSTALKSVERQLARCEETCDEKIAALRADWHADRTELQQRIVQLEASVSKYRHDATDFKAGLSAASAIVKQMDLRIQELGGRPVGMMQPPKET